MFYYVYILESSKDKSLYIGFSTNLVKRLKDHNNGKNVSTREKTPYELIYYEALKNKKDALNREKYLKTGFGRRSISKIIANYMSS